jgi:hypothetical protein
MATMLDKRLASFADQLKDIMEPHETMNQESEEQRVVFNAQFKKIMFADIRPVIQGLLDSAARQGHWIEIHTLMDERFRLYVHQCYTIYWKNGGKADLAVIANYDCKKIFLIVEQGGKSSQLEAAPHEIHQKALANWFLYLFPTL